MVNRLAGTKQTGSTGPYLALITVQVLFATMPIAGKIVLRALPPMALVGFRAAGATIMLLAVVQVGGRFRFIEWQDWPLLVLSSVLGLICNQWLYITGLSLTTAINSTLISTSIPVATLLVGIILGTDHATTRRILGILLAAVGVLSLVARSGGGFSSSTRAGDLLIVANSLCYGTYIAVSKNLVRRYSSLNVITWIFIIGSFACVPVGIISLRHISLSTIPANVWLALIYVVALPTAGAYFLNAWALARVPPSTVAVYIYLQPLIAFFLAPVILGEKVGLGAILSSLLILAGVLVVTRRRKTQFVDEAAHVSHP